MKTRTLANIVLSLALAAPASARAVEVAQVVDAARRLLAQEPAAPRPNGAHAPVGDPQVNGAPKAEEPKSPKKEWYQSISIRGYTQIRYNRLLENNENLTCPQCDASLGSDQGFFVRRARVIFSGDVHERVYIYIQPDFASSAGTTRNVAQLRDVYFDLALDPLREHRFRVGQSKVPYGFENLQSSQNRLALDRNDALNSAVANERDLGVFYYWAPAEIRRRFSYLVSSGLKGSGDYGVFGVGVYNGQTANVSDANDSLHAVARLSYPFKLAGGQIIEPGIQGYTGRYVVTSRTAGAQAPSGHSEVRDERAAASIVVYPQPLGFQSEWTFGEGPEYEPATNTIRRKPLRGGYAQVMYMANVKGHTLIPFVRAQYYQGGKKHETDARRYLVREIEFGAEWQPHRNFELVAMYAHSDRAYQDAASRGNRQEGGRLRLQLQINY